jgi:hypothetical protein
MNLYHSFTLDHPIKTAVDAVMRRTPGVTVATMHVHPVNRETFNTGPFEAIWDESVPRTAYYIKVEEVVITHDNL